MLKEILLSVVTLASPVDTTVDSKQVATSSSEKQIEQQVNKKRNSKLRINKKRNSGIRI